jgi:DNA-binding transcriptional LysR family regulator
MIRVELELMRWFLSVADGTTVTETANRAHITQPALSRALARLEREVGAQLFQRVGRGLQLTPSGREFEVHARTTLEAYDRGRRAVSDLTDPEAGMVPLAFLHTLGTWLVPALIKSFRAQLPRVRFDLRQHGDIGLVEDLLAGVVDLAITGDEPQNPLIQWRRLMVQPLRLVVPPEHRLGKRHRVRLSEVADDTFVVLKPGFGLRSLTERLCIEAGFRPNIGFEGEEVETLRGLVAAGLGVSLLPDPYTGAEPSASHLHVTDVKSARDIGLAWLADRRLPPASERFRVHVLNTTRRVAKSPPGEAISGLG